MSDLKKTNKKHPVLVLIIFQPRRGKQITHRFKIMLGHNALLKIKLLVEDKEGP